MKLNMLEYNENILESKLVAQLAAVAVWAILLNASLSYWYEPLTTENFCQKEFGRGDTANRCAKGIALIQWGTILIPPLLGLITYSIILKKCRKNV